MEKVFENFTITVMKLNKLVNRIKVHEMKSYGLKAIHVMCIYYLNENPQGLRATELIKLTFEDKAAISRGLSLLRSKGYVSYDLNTYNAVIRLTDEGKKVADFITDKSEKAVNAGSAVLSDEERVQFYQSLHAIADNLTNYYKQISAK
ncbi:MAG: winged helix-turn-helix transcriptional regulator [Clostridiales bacterium]|nr:winged helix-turn-helix transcriptional regulator [Clostridiales bacterium]